MPVHLRRSAVLKGLANPVLLCLGLTACGGDEVENAAENQVTLFEPGPLAASKLETEARQLYTKQKKEAEAATKLQEAVKAAMAPYLFDPFSAQYRKIRAGKNGAICGQHNAKNRYGAYVGFKFFVIEKDRDNLYTGSMADIVDHPYSDFALSYIASCASPSEVRAYRQLTAPAPMMEDDDYSDANAMDI